MGTDKGFGFHGLDLRTRFFRIRIWFFRIWIFGFLGLDFWTFTAIGRLQNKDAPLPQPGKEIKAG